MGGQVGDGMIDSVMIMRIPQERCFDKRGLAVAEPMFRLSIIRNGAGISQDGNETYFRNLISGINDCINGNSAATVIAEVEGE